MKGSEVSTRGIFVAIAFSLIATLGQSLTTDRSIDHYNSLWLAIYALSFLTLCGAAVNFDPKRWLN